MKTPNEILEKLYEANQLEPFIRYIRFPHYKALVADSRIDFQFPITVLVGQNGSNKSSVLKALFGAPGKNNLGTLWFSTSVDPIEDSGERSRFIYGYQNARIGKVVEVIKTRIYKAHQPDYWEPSRPLTKDGMKSLPKLKEGEEYADRSNTRWNAIDKEVVYLDFRSEISAFDKYFYHGDLNKSHRITSKQDFLRARSEYLKQCIDSQSSSLLYYGKNRVFDNRTLNAETLKQIGLILGREYGSIRLIRHTLFEKRFGSLTSAGTSIVMTQAGRSYSEAFAGSGEFAAVMLVDKMMQAKPRSLVLLDEPEVSLHPGAQERLMSFLRDQIRTQKHQVVLSTHSPTLIQDLPRSAIKVFDLDAQTGRTIIRENVTPTEAFFYIGQPVPNKLTIITEDVLASEIVKSAMRPSGDAVLAQLDIRSYPGGAETLYKHYLPIFAAVQRKDLLVLLDGDKKPTATLPLQKDLTNDTDALESIIFAYTGTKPVFSVDGGSNGGNEDQKLVAQKQFIAWLRKYVDFLSSTPEEVIWASMSTDLSKGITASNPKSRFEKLARRELGLGSSEELTSIDILGTQKRALATIPPDTPALEQIVTRIGKALERLG